jgi:hypothetical protein
MVEETVIGPRSKYRIVLRETGKGSFQYQVEDRSGHGLGPERAKIFINPAASRPRLLFKDPESHEWVEPESYYSFTSPIFYETNPNTFSDDKAGLRVKAIKSSAWHGVPTIAYKFMTEKSNLLFSADTVYRPSLWKSLCEEYRPQSFTTTTRQEFERSSIIYGDINDFIERTWSRRRYETALAAYRDSVVIHDVARKNSIVHTDYADIAQAPLAQLIFTHSPDNLTAWRPILTSHRRLVLRNGQVYEAVKGALYPFDADVYVHHFSCDLVGYASADGQFVVIEKDGLLGVVGVGGAEAGLMTVNLYQDIQGEYFPLLLDPKKTYGVRGDGKVEEVTHYSRWSLGRVVQNRRGRIKSEKGKVSY